MVFDTGSMHQARESLILFSMLSLGTVILAADIFLPLGFVIWILYLIPLLMSVWLSFRYAPFYSAWLITLCVFLGSMVSGAVRTSPSDLPNRAIFILMMAIVALLVWEIRTNYSALDHEVSERRTIQKNLEELTRSLESRVEERTGKLSEVNQALQDDIAKRTKAEASLAAANQKLTLLSQITRHDISNRIFSLLVDIHLAREYATDITFRKSLDKMEQTSMAIVDQINFTKDYQEIGTKAPSWHPVAPMIRHAAGQLDTEGIVIEISPENREIFADGMIRKVFYNLIDNALRHGSHVTRIGFSAHETPEGLVIVCEDNGTGIPASDKEQIFSKGFGRGSGLGLFLTREILSITGITIRECGEYGKGARFEMTVPQGDYRSQP